MDSKLEEKKKKLEEQIEKNLLRKKLLLAKEKKKRASKFNEIGRLAYRANIDQMDENALLGAFLEIAQSINNDKLKLWQSNAEKFSKAQSNQEEQVFSISFLEEPNPEIKKKLKESKFSWNRFRKEFYGKGNRNDIINLLKDSKFKIEEIIH